MHTRRTSIFILAAFCAAMGVPARAADALDLLRGHGREPERAVAAGRFTANFDGVPLGEAVREIARRGNANVIFSPMVATDTPVRLSFTDIPWRAALESILKAHGCAVVHDADGRIIRISTGGEADRQFETRSRPLRYVRPENGASLVSALESVKSEDGGVTHESRTNTLIIRDTPAKIREMLRLVDEIDVPPQQVLIETRMITSEDNPASGCGTMSRSDLDLLVRTARLDDTVGIAQVPQILVLDNEEASVFIGDVRARPSGKKEILVGMRLIVIPRVCKGTDQVILEIIPEQTDSPEFAAARAGGGTTRIPANMRVKTVRTKIMLRSGETGVIAGLFRNGTARTAKRNTMILVTATIIPPEHGEEFDRDVEELRESLASSL